MEPMATTKKFKIAPEIKSQILERVKQGDKPIAEIAQEHGVSPHTIYGWLSKGATAPPTWVEINKLKRENQALMALIGEFTMKLSKAEKKGAR